MDVLTRHRVEGLTRRALCEADVSIPQQFATGLDEDAVAIARQNLAFAAEALRLARFFEGRGLPFLFVKGTTLDMLAYGTLGLKRARDIDLLIAPDAAEAAFALMKEAGYDRIVPGPEVDAEGLPIWLKLCKETNWQHRQSGIVVEIHNQLVENSALLRGIDAHSTPQHVMISATITLPTLHDEALYSYLSVHGASHGWSRLKWLADLAAFLSRRSPGDIERLHEAATALGAGRASAQALMLCDRLFATPVSPALKAKVANDRLAAILARVALGILSTERDLDDTVFGTVPIHVSHLLLGRGLRFKVGEIARKIKSPQDRTALPLPRVLTFLYPIILFPNWVRRRTKTRTLL
jgi:hypothetical protein